MDTTQAPPPEDDLERWITDLARETSVRELPEPTVDDDSADADACPTCSGSSARPDHLPTLRSA